jgi:beta-barrel assembly-enhancing protease
MIVRLIAIFTLAAGTLTAQEQRVNPRNGVNYSLDKEAALGQQIAAEFRQRTIPIDNPIIQDYVRRLGQKIGAPVSDAKFPFTFSVFADDSCDTLHEPPGLPGGYVFVPAGLFVAAQDDAEFAGMLAHAMERIVLRDWTRWATRATNAPIPVTFLEGWAGGCFEGQAVPLASLSSQRSAELEADVLAVAAMARAGFDPNALVRYLERQAPAAGTVSKVFSPIPNRDERVAALLASIAKLPRVNYVVAPSGELATARQEVRRLMRPAARSGEPPSLMRKTPK